MLALLMLMALPGDASATPARTPVVLFPAWHFTRLEVTAHHQKAAPECPASGSFQDLFLNDRPSTTFSQICQDKLLTLRYDPAPWKPMPLRFSDQPGVDVRIADYGRTSSAPFYETLYRTLESAGYVRDKDIRVAGYDARLTPDMGGFLGRAKRLVEDTYRDNGNRPVQLVGHSNGPLYIQYLLTHTSKAWRAKYVHGFTPLAGNFPGQGLLYSMMFTGLTVQDGSYPQTPEGARSSALMYISHPSTYMSSSDPRVFGDREVIVRTPQRTYTPRDYRQLYADAGIPHAREIGDYYIGFVSLRFPGVDVYGEKGSGLPTIVGAQLPDLTVGQIVPTSRFLYRDGDANQEDITNEAILAWQGTPCYRFSLRDNPGVTHFDLPGDPNVLSRLLTDLGRERSHCP